ncbi:MAG: PrsW family intramembrane metalloprotease [Pegethrix bostrychoides GSE-TBD4-15B]|jgi:RsiW-degrading membrane proteinase PrsW (M82 family)|uniref:PrsW family intramembrane metalloprotease n=1 Tax=Pegethrix bostrychoides GSE-TBD4-15B TaxID=2839662 RepID=A0A951P7T8_9CYAN|nr:PrsW family intramembrane metalloprotease [Pegethrix bostrychoides GSE-TBD4-15B]
MIGAPSGAASLRRIASHYKESALASYPLVTPVAVVIGRDPRCQIVLDSQLYGSVSRQHVRISPISTAPSGWQICDLDSANGTFINGQRLQGCRHLQPGDLISLSQTGPQFMFELRGAVSGTVTKEPASQPPTEPDLLIRTSSPPAKWGQNLDPARDPARDSAGDALTLSQLFPILSTGRDLTRKAYLIPGIVTVSFVVMMFVSIGQPEFFNMLLSAYIAGIAYYLVYQLCGKQKPWWLLLGAGLTTVLLLLSPVLTLFLWLFRQVLPGGIPADSSAGFFSTLVQMFFGAGLMEELLKAIPILLAYWLGTKLRSPYREQVGVWEPLDGILLGTASAVGFTLLETLGQYVPGVMNDVTLQAGVDYRELLGLQLLIPRILGSISGHMAYSGYLGYFIGLSVLKPAKRWQILSVGYLTAASLHALWNTMGLINLLVLAVVGVVSYAFLTAAILKARLLSPTRAENFATRFTRLR